MCYNATFYGVFMEIFADFTTILFILLICGLFVVGIRLESLKTNSPFTSYIPMLLTSLGILGTFIGISIGLATFNPQDIDSSIANLLAGMKTAFYTSLAGMASSILYQSIKKIKFTHKSPHQVAPTQENIIPLLTQQVSALQELITLNKAQESSLATQNKLLKTEIGTKLNNIDKNTLESQKYFTETLEKTITQISKEMLLQTEIFIQLKTNMEKQQESFKEFQKVLWDKFQEFADILSKSATEQVIEALKQVIIEFNSNLTEQFGENFKELNVAVFTLVQWQENYKMQIAEMIEQYKLGAESITQTSQAVLITKDSISEIQQATQNIPQTMESLTEILEIQKGQLTLQQKQVENLQNNLETFAEIKDKATQSLPYISEKVHQITEDISNSVTKTTHHYDALQGRIGEIQEHFRESTEHFKNQLSSLVENSISAMQKEMESQVKESMQSLTKSHQTIQKNMEKEIDQSMASIGGALTEIAKKIVEEYNKMQRYNG